MATLAVAMFPGVGRRVSGSGVMFSYDRAIFYTLDSSLACQYTYNKANN